MRDGACGPFQASQFQFELKVKLPQGKEEWTYSSVEDIHIKQLSKVKIPEM